MISKSGIFEELPLDQMQLVESYCSQFETIRRNSGDEPAVEPIRQLLRQAPANLQTVVFCELLHIELEWLNEKLIVPAPEVYLTEFPERAKEIYRQCSTFVRSDPSTTEHCSIQTSVAEKLKLAPEVFAGRVIDDRYTILKRIGQGGMGTVYLAEQSVPVARKVAVKLIKAGLDSEKVLARFDVERGVLALMDHPGIARVFDGGQTDDGLPYFVMEFVNGIPLTKPCDQQQLSVPERLSLFLDVCGAVQHAHAKGVIHRDLKPGNILVSQLDGRPVIKVIDFGVAKAVDQNQISDANSTAEMIVGTPLYMSPEQTVSGCVDVDIRADVYSLGVILYELLTGETPLKVKAGSSNLLEILGQIRDTDAPKPSSSLENSQARTEAATTRRSNLRGLSRLLKGDLDWISLKALEKDRSRRYQTAMDLAQDIDRYLNNGIVEARPPSSTYRFRKFVARNKVATIAASLLLLTMTAGIVGTSWGMYQARQQAEKTREEARQKERALVEKQDALLEESRQRAFAESITEFLERDFLQLTSSYGRLESNVTAINEFSNLEDLLDHAVMQLDSREDLSRQAEARLTSIIAESYEWRGAKGKAVPLYEKSKRLYSELYGTEDLRTINALRKLGENLLAVGQVDRGFSLIEEAFAITKKTRSLANEDSLLCMGALANAHRKRGEFDQAVALSEDCLKRTRSFYETTGNDLTDPRVLGARHIFVSMYDLSLAYKDAARASESIEILEKALELYEQDFGIDDPDIRVCRGLLGSQYVSVGQFSKATPILKEEYQWCKANFGAKSKESMYAMVSLARCVRDLGQTDLAVSLSKEILEIAEQEFGKESLNYAEAQRTLALSYRDDGAHDLALPFFQSHLDSMNRIFGEEHPNTLRAMGNLVAATAATGKLDQAIEIRELLLVKEVELLGEQHPATFSSKNGLAVDYWKRGQLSRSIPLFEEVREFRVNRFGKTHPSTISVEFNLGVSYLDAGQFDKSIAILETVQRNLDSAPWLTQNALSFLFAAYLLADQHDQARDLLPKYFEAQKDQLSRKKPILDGFSERLDKLMAKNRWRESLTIIREWTKLNQEHAPKYSAVYYSHLKLGYALLRIEKYDEAESDFITVFEGLANVESSSPRAAAMVTKNRTYAVQSLIQLKEAMDDEEGVKQWKAELEKLKTVQNLQR
mgnify:CR=1 FL=1